MPGHARRKERAGVVLPLSSLIDIVFLLLVYFLLTTNFMVDEALDLKLPQARSAAPQLEQPITVFVGRDGRVLLGGREVAMAYLFGQIKARVAGRKDAQVVIKADRRVILNQAVKVMDLAKAAGAARLFLATEKDF